MSRSKAEIARKREARRAAKLNEREKLALEARLVREGKIYPRAHYMPRGRFRGILAVALAFLFGIILAFGGLIGAGVFLGTKTSLKKLLGENAEKWLEPQYADMSILDLVSTVVKDVPNIKTIGDISKYTPAVDRLLNTLSENMEDLGVDFNDELRTKLKATSFEKIGEFFMEDIVKTAQLGKIAKVNGSSDALLLALCYGEEGIDYEVDGEGNIQLLEGGRTPTSVKDLMEDPTKTLNTIRLGTLMGLNTGVTEQKLSDNAMMYALCYGKRGEDYELEDGRIVVLADQTTKNSLLAKEGEGTGTTYVHTFPTTLEALMNHSNDVVNALELGTVLGIDSDVTEQKIEDNGVMYSLAYGARGTDWELKGGKIEMLEGHGEDYPTKMQSFTENSSNLIQSMQVETLMGIKPDSDKLMHYLAYGPELQKGEEPYTQQGDGWFDKDGKRVDENGYLLAEDGTFLTEPVLNDEGAPTEEMQYAGGGTFVYEYTTGGNGEKTVSAIKMLPDLKDPQKTIAKKQVKDLTEKEAKLLDGMKLGDVMEIDSSSSGLMKSIKNWTIDDLKQQNKIDSLKVADVIGEDASSNIIQAFAKRGTTLGQLKEQDTINSLKLSEVLTIDDTSSGIMKAMKDWKIEDLQNQNRIERLSLGQVIEIGADSSKIMNAMKNWRIGDLSSQDKIDSLALGDVLDLDGPDTPALLKSLSTSRLGDLGDRVDTLRLSEIMDESQLDGNKILKHLKESTIDSLATDIQELTVGEVFGDEMYSYMKIEEKELALYDPMKGSTGDAQTYHITYNWLYTTYFGKANKADDKRPNNYHYAQFNGLQADGRTKDESAFDFRPQAVAFSEGETVTVRLYIKGKDNALATEGYYKHGGKTPVPDGVTVLRNTKDALAKYYYENKIVLTPHYVYGVYNYETGTVGETKDLVDGKFYYKDDPEPYEVKHDEFDNYYIEVPVAGSEEEFDRIDLERVVSYYTIGEEDTHYTPDDGKITYNESAYTVVQGKTHEEDYIVEKVGVDKGYLTDGDDTLYHEENIEERYFYTPAGTGAEVELDRYVSGVWYLLLGEKTEDGGIIFKTDEPILNVDGLIQDVSGSMQNTLLAELWFHGLIDENPYTDFSKIYPTGLTFTSEGKEERTVYNLIEVSLNETLGLVKALTAKIGGFGS